MGIHSYCGYWRDYDRSDLYRHSFKNGSMLFDRLALIGRKLDSECAATSQQLFEKLKVKLLCRASIRCWWITIYLQTISFRLGQLPNAREAFVLCFRGRNLTVRVPQSLLRMPCLWIGSS